MWLAAVPISGAAAWLLPAAARACSVCAGTLGGDATWYLWATLLMLVVPVALIGGFGLWLRRQLRASRSSEESTQRFGAPRRAPDADGLGRRGGTVAG